ncbi:hypothetical protein pb186bvf_008511 [Paramecium bursaria]
MQMDAKIKNKRKNNYQKIHQADLVNLVGFQVQDPVQPQEFVRRVPQMNQRQIKERQQSYVKQKLQFIVLQPQYEQEIRWNNVCQVIFNTHNDVICPICMNEYYEMTVPYITACGHVYCLPCYTRHLSVSKHGHKCPLCGEMILQDEIRSVHINKKESIHEGQEITLIQLIRNKGQFQVFQRETKQESINHSRALTVDESYLCKQYYQELEQLQNIIDISEEDQKIYIQDSINFILKVVSKFKDKHTDNSYLLDNLHLKMMDSGGSPSFLHPLCYKYIQLQYDQNDLKKFTSKIIGIYKLTQNEQTYKRYKFLNHIPFYSEFYFLDVELNALLKQDLLEEFQIEMQEYRKRYQQSIKQVEPQKQQKIKQASPQPRYHIIIQDDNFQFNAEEFPKIEEPVIVREESTKDLDNQFDQNQDQQKQKKLQNQNQNQKPPSVFDDKSNFPRIDGVEPTQYIDPQTIQWGKQVEKVEPQQTIQQLPIEFDFPVIGKKKKKRNK